MSAPSAESEAEFGRQLVEQGLARPEHVRHCLELIATLRAQSVSPLPRLGELLAQMGYMTRGSGGQTAQALSEPTKTPSHPKSPDLPPEAARGEAFGKYVKTRLLGAGGMGEVWKAWDTELGRWVALKFIKSQNDEERARFRREAQTAAKLGHPHIAAIYEAGDSFIAMQYVEGRTLENFPRDDRRLVADVIRQAASAVDFAHEQGVIHRDLKPANIMVVFGRQNAELQVYVMDFGLAKSMNVESSLSVSGMILGTPSYMAPEQARGRTQLTRAADVYALGATLYSLLTGRPPFESEDIYGLLHQVIDEDPKPVRKIRPEVAPELETITMKCLEKDPAQRYATARALAEDLTRWLEGDAILAHPPSTFYRVKKFVARRRVVFFVGGAGLLLAATVALLLVPKLRAEARAKREAAERARLQDEAFKLFEAGRPALDKAGSYLYKANAEYGEIVKRVESGQTLIEQGIAKAPELALGHFLLGRAWEIRGEYERAESSWRRAIACDADYGPAHYRLGKLLLIRSFLITLAATRTEREARDPEAAALAAEGAREIELAHGQSGSDDALEHEIAQAMLAYSRHDGNAIMAIATPARDKFKGVEGVEEIYWLASFALGGKDRLGAYNAALRIRPRYPVALFCRAMYYDSKGQLTDAMADYTEAIKVHPRMWQAYLNRGNTREKMKDFEGAISDYEEALRIDPRSAAARSNLSWVCFARGDLGRALSEANEAIRTDPRHPPAYFARATVYRAKSEFDPAMADFNRAIQLDADYAEAYVGRALTHHDKGNIPAALADYAKAIGIRPYYAMAWYNRAHLRAETGDIKGAIEDYTQAIGYDPLDAEARRSRGVLRLDHGDPKGALADFDEAVKLAPKNPVCFYSRGNALYRAGRLEEAVADFSEAIRLDSKYADAYINRGSVLQDKGDLKGAIADYSRVIGLKPLDPLARFNRGVARADSGDATGALEDYDEALRLDPDYFDAYVNRGGLRRKRNDLDGALRDLDNAVRLKPKSPEAFFNRALAKAGKNDGPGAIADLEQTLKVASPDWRGRKVAEETLKTLRGEE